MASEECAMICKLCSNTGNLCNSHIVPEFMYEPLYDDKHRMIFMTE